MTPAQLARAVAGLTPPLARALLAALEDWQLRASRLALARLERAVASGDVQLVVRLVLGDAIADAVVVTAPPFPDAGIAYPRTAAPSPAAIAALTRAEAALQARAEASVRLAYRLGEGVLPPRPPVQTAVGADLPEPIPPRPVVVFRAGLPDAAAGATRYAGEALSYLRAEAHAGVRAAVEAGLQAGVNPRDIARQLRDVVGLGASQARWVANLRMELEAGRYAQALGRQLLNGPIRRTVEAAARANRPLTAQQLDRVVEGYAGKWRAWHAETIARTMALDLARHGQDAAMRAAIARGDYAGLVVFKTWITTVDGRERDAHRALNGRRIRFEATWNDDGVERRVPGGWNCRCSVRLQAVPEGAAAADGTPAPPAFSGPPADLGSADTLSGGRIMARGTGGAGGNGGGGDGTRTGQGASDGGADPDYGEWVGRVLAERRKEGRARLAGSIADETADELARAGVVLERRDVVLTDERLLHSRRAVKERRGAAFTEAELRAIPEMLASPAAVFLQTDGRIVLAWPRERSPRVLKLVIAPNTTRQVRENVEDRVSRPGNYIITAGVVNWGNLEGVPELQTIRPRR